MKQILLVDDDKEFCDIAQQMLSLLQYDVTLAHSLEEANQYLSTVAFDNILLDFMLPDGSGLHMIDQLQEQAGAPPVTLITGHPSVKTLMAGLVGPKVNYLLKPLTRESLEGALAGSRSKTMSVSVAKKHFGCLIGESDSMHKLYEMIERVSKTKANVMLMGESGVGKEVVAQAIHNTTRHDITNAPLVAANCGAFSKELIGSELFGHEKGAFTGAVGRKAGVFEQADDGTLFLDEVTEMPMDIQPNLLRVLETGRVTRVGGTKDFSVNCRVISATNRTEVELAEDNVLREDMYFRLAVFPIRIPPLRARAGDIPLLANAFLHDLNNDYGTQLRLSDSQLDQLTAYEWPGNVRELRHAIHRAYIMSDPTDEWLTVPCDLASPFSKQHKKSNQISPGQRIDDVEKELIQATLQQLDGDKPAAADMLGISLKTLYNRLNKYEQEASV